MSALNDLYASFTRLVEKITQRMDWLGSYACTIISQSSDLKTVDVKPDFAKIPELNDVPIKWGNPGVKCRLSSGSRAMLSFENGHQDKPYISMWMPNAVEELLLGDATDFVARSTSLSQWMANVSNHTHNYTDTSPAGAIPSVTLPPTTLNPPDIASNKVKA